MPAIPDGTFKPRNGKGSSTIIERVYVISSQSSYYACQQGHNVQTTDVFLCYFRYPSIGQAHFRYIGYRSGHRLRLISPAFKERYHDGSKTIRDWLRRSRWNKAVLRSAG